MSYHYTVYKTSGLYVKNLELNDPTEVSINTEEDETAVEGEHDASTYLNGNDVLPRPTIPAPAVSGILVDFPDPPPGLHVRAYDMEAGGYLMGEGDLELPDARVKLPDPGLVRLQFTADFPWLDITIEQEFPNA